MTDTQDAAPRVRVEERYPAARAGLAYLAAVLDGTADENVAQFHALDAAGIADMFLSCVELRTVIEDVVRRQLNRETTDRFLSQHSSDVERAVRAHWRESAELREQSARLVDATVMRQTSSAWWRQQRQMEAQLDDALRTTERERIELARQRGVCEQFIRDWESSAVTSGEAVRRFRTDFPGTLKRRAKRGHRY
jgi:hypothetical protein